MPELPEIETIRLSLQKAIVGKTIKNIEVRKPKIFKGNPKEVIGKKIENIKRRGKILIINLSQDLSLVIHFKLTGQLLWIEKSEIKKFAWQSSFGAQKSKIMTLGHPIPFAGSELPAKTTHVIFDIDGGRLFYNDLRQFGWIKIANSDQLSVISDQLGVEPFSKEFTMSYLEQIFSKTKKPIKLVLMDQAKIAGIGNIYANEALFEAGISPAKPAKKLRNREIKKLRKSIRQVLEDGIKYGGSSAENEAYIKPNGTKGAYQEHLKVYQKEGETCLRCGTKIKRINLGGRGTFFCPKCQK